MTYFRPSRSPVAWLAAVALALPGALHAFDLQGHRGARGLAPENTLAAFEAALDIGVSTLELDLALTADGVVVISHDPRLNPAITRDADGRFLDAAGPAIHRLTLAQLQAYDVGRLRPGTRYAGGFPAQQAVDGERIPTLAALFERVAARGDAKVRFNMEFKLGPDIGDITPAPQPFAEAVLAVVRRHGMEGRVTLQGFDWRALRVAQQLAPGIPTAYLSAQRPRFDTISDGRWTDGYTLAEHGSLPKMVKAAGGAMWAPHFADLNAALLREAHELGLKVAVWTVNEPSDIERMLDLGVDGLISDRPDLVREAMARRGMPLP